MSKNKKIKSKLIKKPDFKKKIMAKVKSGQVKMRSRWFFIAGSVLSFLGLIGLSITAVFFSNIIFFVLRKHGPMGQWRLEIMLSSLPFWIPVIAIASIAGGIWFLKKYDFSYKKNFLFIIIGFIISVIVAAWIIDLIGLNEMLLKRGQMGRFYQRFERQGNILQENWGNKLYRRNIQK